MNDTDQALMRRALELARLGRGQVEPNPMVGCVIAREGRIIAQGYHQRFGGPHAERQALSSSSQSPAGATAYVTLEPCCHTSKKTPPCVPALIEAGIARVVVACLDPNPMVSGNGIAQLRQAGITVETGLLQDEARQLNAPFFATLQQHRPYVTLKWAQTADAKIAGPGGTRLQISSPASMAIVHRLRARSDAILVGINTVFSDDPLLTTRGVASPRPLVRVILDTHLRLPITSQLVQTAQQHPLIVYCSSSAPQRDDLAKAGVRIVRLSSHPPALQEILHDLGNQHITHLLVEGGPTVARGFLDQNLADRAWVFRSPRRVDDPTAPAAPALSLPTVAQATVDIDRVTEHLNPASPAFFLSEPSVDFLDLVQGR